MSLDQDHAETSGDRPKPKRSRSLTRIVSNYLRLMTNLVLGLALARLLLPAVGDEAFGLMTFFALSVSLPNMLRQVVSQSMIRELGVAYHGSEKFFRETYSSALVICIAVAGLTCVLYGIVFAVIPHFPIPETLMASAYLLIAAFGVQSVSSILTMPINNLYLIGERMVTYNTMLIVERAGNIIGTIAILVGPDSYTIQERITVYAIVSTSWVCTVHLAWAGAKVLSSKRYRLTLRHTTRQEIKRILSTGGWNTAIAVAMTMHVQLDSLLVFLAFSTYGGRVFGLAMQLAYYIRMITSGIKDGLSAVSTRLDSDDDAEQKGGSHLRLIRQSTRLGAGVSVPFTIGAILFAEPFISFWVGDQLANPAEEIPQIAMIVRTLAVGVLSLSLSELWIEVLYGAGMIKRYAPLVIAGALANPILASFLLWGPAMPDHLRIFGPAISYLIIMCVVHFGMISLVTARTLEVSWHRVVGPTLRPAAVSVTAGALALPFVVGVSSWQLRDVILPVAIYASVLAIGYATVCLSREERALILKIALRRG